MKSNDEYSRKLKHIEDTCVNLWKGQNLAPYFYTPHDTHHSRGVISYIRKLIPDFSKLNSTEQFLITAAAWLHDVGMIPYLFPSDPSPPITKQSYLDIREKHHMRSKDYVENTPALGLSSQEATMIGMLCRYHRRRENIEDLKRIDNDPNVRLTLLASYLRLADAIHIDSSRVDDYRNLYNLFLSNGMPLFSEFHWLRSFWIRKIEANSKEALLTIYLNFKEEDRIDGVQYLIDSTVRDIIEELDSIKNILIKHRLSFYIDIDYKFGLGIDERTTAKLKQIISRLRAKYTASSGQLANILIDTIKYMIEMYQGSAADKVNMIARFNETEIAETIKDRPCHALLSHVSNITSNVLKQDLTPELKLSSLNEKLVKLLNERKDNIARIARYSHPFLADCSPILLFGYSSIIIDALDRADEFIKTNTAIYVAECRNKNQLSYQNDLLYCDGLRYVLDLSKTGYKNVYLIPDAVVGNLLRKRIKKVFIGANAVDIANKIVGHTAGHSTIINSALRYQVPIYVFVDTYKFGRLQEDADAERDINWFTGENLLARKLREKNIRFCNPRTDIIELDHVYMFITELGNFPPSQIPAALEQKIKGISSFEGG